MGYDAGSKSLERKQKLREVSIVFDCYGDPKTPGVIPIGKADKDQCEQATKWGRTLRQAYKARVVGSFQHMKEQMKLDYDQTEESFLNNKAVPPQAQTQDASDLAREAYEKRLSNHDIHSGKTLKQLLDETHNLSLHGYRGRLLKTITEEEAALHAAKRRNHDIGMEVKAAVQADNIDIGLPDDHKELREKAQRNPIVRKMYAKVSDVPEKPNEVESHLLIRHHSTPVKRGNQTSTNLPFDDYLEPFDMYRSSAILSSHHLALTNTSADRLPMLSKGSKKEMIPRARGHKSDRFKKLPPIHK